MKSIEFLTIIRERPEQVMTVTTAANIINKSLHYTRLYLYRLKRKGYIYEIERGKYTLSQDLLETACELVLPSYISFLSAYNLYGLTTQIPLTIYVVTTKPKRQLVTNNYMIKFISFPKVRFFGYHRQRFREKYITIADREKAIIDSLYLPKYCPIDETAKALQQAEIDIHKLIRYAKKMNSIVLLKRLGYLLEQQDIDVYHKLKHTLNKRYDVLNPFLPRSGKNSTKWKLNINEVDNASQ